MANNNLDLPDAFMIVDGGHQLRKLPVTKN